MRTPFGSFGRGEFRGAVVGMVYELFDEPQKKPPENRFGLMYEIDRPKVALFLLSEFAGGRLSAEELTELRTRGL